MKSPLFRIIFSKQFWRRALFLFVALVTCIAAAYNIETFRSKRAWERYKQDAQRRGIEFDPAAFNKPAIPDDQNYAVNPYLMGDAAESDQMLQGLATFSHSTQNADSLGTGARFPLGQLVHKMREKKVIQEGKGEDLDQILTFLRQVPALEHLRQASLRPDCRFPSDYRDGYAMEASHILRLSKAAVHFENRAHVAIAKNDSAAAREDCRQLFRMSEALQSEVYLLSMVVRVGVLNRITHVMHDGILAGVWTDEQLSWFEEQWAKQEILAHLVDSARSERAICCAYMEVWAEGKTDDVIFVGQRVQQVCPSGWFYRNAIAVSKMQERFEESFLINPAKEKKELLGPSFDRIYDELPTPSAWNRLVYVEAFLTATQKDVIKSMLIKMNAFRASRVSILLELEFRKVGKYPSELAPLVGDGAYACDVSDGKIFGYQVTTDGYELRSSDGKTLWKIKHVAAR